MNPCWVRPALPHPLGLRQDRSGGSKTLGERHCHIADDLGIEARSKIKSEAQRVDNAGIGIHSLQHGGHQTFVELWFRKDAIDAFITNPTLNLGDAGRTWIRGVAKGNRACCLVFEGHLEILIGIMKHDEAAAPDRIKHRVDLDRQRLQLFARSGGVRKIRTGIIRINSRKLRRHQVQPCDGIFGREPGMGIMCAMRVVVMGHFLMLFVLVMVIVIVMPFILVMLVLVMIVFIFMTMLLFFAVHFRLKECAFPETEQRCLVGFEKRRDRSIPGQRLQGALHPGRQFLAHPENKVGLLQGCRIGRTQAVPMGRGTLSHNQARCADILHHARHERMHRCYVNRDVRRIRQGAAPHQRCCDRNSKKPSGHLVLHVITFQKAYLSVKDMTSKNEPMPAETSAPVGFQSHDHAACVDGALSAAEERSAIDGLRLTPVRRKVLEILLQEHRAVGAYVILDFLREAGFGSQPPVVYRALDFLVEHGFVHRIERLNAFIACSIPGMAHSPAFMICRHCDAVAEAHSEPVEDALEAAASAAGFRVEQTVVESEGVCAVCSEKATT